MELLKSILMSIAILLCTCAFVGVLIAMFYLCGDNPIAIGICVFLYVSIFSGVLNHYGGFSENHKRP